MADWFDITNAQDAFATTATTRTVLHGQAAKGQPLAEKSFIIAVSGLRHEDAADFLSSKATDKAWDDISDAFDDLYKKQGVARGDHMWLTNFTKTADANANDTNSQMQAVHIHILSGELKEGFTFIRDQRSFHPHPKKDIYKELHENRQDILGLDAGNGITVVPLPPGVKEAEQHYMVAHKGYKSFADFIETATREEKRSFWKTVAKLALPLVEQGHGARVGYYNFRGEMDAQLGHMAVEVAGGENLGQNGLKKRWFDNPSPPK